MSLYLLHEGRKSCNINCNRESVCLCCMKARARLELREEASKEDALDVIEIMKYRFDLVLASPCKEAW
jgi:hypothetical protein